MWQYDQCGNMIGKILSRGYLGPRGKPQITLGRPQVKLSFLNQGYVEIRGCEPSLASSQLTPCARGDLNLSEEQMGGGLGKGWSRRRGGKGNWNWYVKK